MPDLSNRKDLQIIQEWVKPNSRLLDLGCGSGDLLLALQNNKQVSGVGVDINDEHITQCIKNGISVIEQDLNSGLSNFTDNSFDIVIMTHALQTLKNPHELLKEMLRIGQEGIVSFPNFGYWRCRYQLGIMGKMPISKFLPDEWYNTPNIHFCTINDFENLCHNSGMEIKHRAVVNANNEQGGLAEIFPNLFALTAVYHLTPR